MFCQFVMLIIIVPKTVCTICHGYDMFMFMPFTLCRPHICPLYDLNTFPTVLKLAQPIVHVYLISKHITPFLARFYAIWRSIIILMQSSTA